MRKLEDFLRPTQNELFNMLRKKYRGETFVRKGSYILVSGEAPVMLLSHLDTVHKKPVKYICKSSGGNILMSPQGIGGDDRCGVYALVKAHEAAPIKPWLLFTCNEEVGGIGAYAFAKDHSEGKTPKGLDDLKFLVEIDRKGSKDAVYYGCNNPEFEEYITSKGFVTADGTFSDISIIAPGLKVAAVNLSSGYHNAHTLHEYINRKQIDAVIKSVIEMIADAAKPDFPKYEYIERVWVHRNLNGGYSSWRDYWLEGGDSYDKPGDKRVPLSSKSKAVDTAPSYLAGMYDALLELYSKDELEWCRKECGDQIISQMYDAEFGPYFDTDSPWADEEAQDIFNEEE